jgi:hypothetical protein
MKAVFFVEKEKYMAAKNSLEGDDQVSRLSIVFRDNQSLGLEKEGYYLELDGREELIAKAKELLKDSEAREVTGEELKKVEDAIESQESKAEEGFGAIFG